MRMRIEGGVDRNEDDDDDGGGGGDCSGEDHIGANTKPCRHHKPSRWPGTRRIYTSMFSLF